MTTIIRQGLAGLLAGLAFASSGSMALAQKAPAAATVSPCKGLDEAACSKDAATCHWIAATTRKDGKAVKAYCRKKPKPKTDAAAPAKPATPAAAATPKAVDPKPKKPKVQKAATPPAAPAAATPATPAKPAAKAAAPKPKKPAKAATEAKPDDKAASDTTVKKAKKPATPPPADAGTPAKTN